MTRTKELSPSLETIWEWTIEQRARISIDGMKSVLPEWTKCTCRERKSSFIWRYCCNFRHRFCRAYDDRPGKNRWIWDQRAKTTLKARIVYWGDLESRSMLVCNVASIRMYLDLGDAVRSAIDRRRSWTASCFAVVSNECIDGSTCFVNDPESLMQPDANWLFLVSIVLEHFAAAPT